MDVDIVNRRDVWLVKVPKYMANAWKSAPARAELGKLQLPKNGSGPVKFITDPKIQPPRTGSSTEVSKLPAEHILTLHPLTHQRMVILAQTRDGPPTATSGSNTSGNHNSTSSNSTTNDKISFEGDVKHRGELRPTGDMSYMNLKTLSIKEAAKPTRVAQKLDKAVTAFNPRGATQLLHEADLRKKKDEAKKLVREDKEIVQGRLFAAFEKQQYYNIKDLVRITNQSVKYLKEILKEICNYSSKSRNKNMWELKPEYRHYKSASGSQSGSK